MDSNGMLKTISSSSSSSSSCIHTQIYIIYIYICIYIYIYMYVCVCVCICICIYLYMHARVCVCTYIYLFIHSFIYTVVQWRKAAQGMCTPTCGMMDHVSSHCAQDWSVNLGSSHCCEDRTCKCWKKTIAHLAHQRNSCSSSRANSNSSWKKCRKMKPLSMTPGDRRLPTMSCLCFKDFGTRTPCPASGFYEANMCSQNLQSTVMTHWKALCESWQQVLLRQVVASKQRWHAARTYRRTWKSLPVPNLVSCRW